MLLILHAKKNFRLRHFMLSSAGLSLIIVGNCIVRMQQNVTLVITSNLLIPINVYGLLFTYAAIVQILRAY